MYYLRAIVKIEQTSIQLQLWSQRSIQLNVIVFTFTPFFVFLVVHTPTKSIIFIVRYNDARFHSAKYLVLFRHLTDDIYKTDKDYKKRYYLSEIQTIAAPR